MFDSKMSKIFDDDSDIELMVKTDNEYAKNYDQWRKKEEINKLKTKYEDFYSNSSESEDDEDGIELTDKVEKDFFKTLACLKNKDPRIYDENVRFFDDNNVQESKNKSKKDKKQPMFIKDYERNLLLEKEGVLSDENNSEDDKSPTYVQEQQDVKEKLKNALNIVEDENGEEWGGIFTKRTKTTEEKNKEDDEYKMWLAGQKTEIADNIKSDLKPLKDYWNNPNLDDGEKFLRDYILKKRFLEKENDGYIPTYDEIIHDSDELSNDENMLEKQEEFEHKYNFRFEEPDQEFIKRYPRTMENSLRQKDDKRKQKRQELKERKQREKETKIQDLKKLRELKRIEIEEKLYKLKEITGNTTLGFEDDDIEGDFDPQSYDKRMQELFNDDFYKGPEGEQKPEFPDLDQELEIENWSKYYRDDNNEIISNNGLHCEDEDFNMDCDYDPSVRKDKTVESKGNKKKKRKSKFAEALSKPKPKFNPNDKTYEEYFDEYYKLDCEDFIGEIPCRFKYRKVIPNNFGLTLGEILSAKERELNKWCSLKKAVQIRPDHIEKYDQIAYSKKAQNIALKKKILPSLFEPEDAESKTSHKMANSINDDKINTHFSANMNEPIARYRECSTMLSKEQDKPLKKIELEYPKDTQISVNIQDKNIKEVEGPPSKKIKLGPDSVCDSLDKNVKSSTNNELKRNKQNSLKQKKIKNKEKQSMKMDKFDLKHEHDENRKKAKKQKKKSKIVQPHLQKQEAAPSKFKDRQQKSQPMLTGKDKIRNTGGDNESILVQLSDKRLSAYGIKPKKFKNKLKYKK